MGRGVPGAHQSPAPSPSLGWPPEAPSSHTSSAFLLCSLLLLLGSLGQVCNWCMCGGRLGGDLGEVRSRPGWLDSPVTRGPGEFPLLSLPGFRTRPPLSRKITPLFPACTPPVQGCPPNPADSTLGLGPRSAEVGGQAGDAEGTCLLPTPSTGSARQAGELGVSRGCNPWLLPLPHHPCRQLAQGRRPGWSRGRKPAQGQQEMQEAAGRVGSGDPGYCSIFSGKKTGGKTEDRGPPPPWAFGESPSGWEGSGGPEMQRAQLVEGWGLAAFSWSLHPV